jgi:hypothetical protein
LLTGSLIVALIDRLVLVSLYERAHSVLEGLAFLTLAIALGGALTSTRAARFVHAFAGLSLLWLVLLAGSPWIRRHLEMALPSTWEQPVYLGRLLRRLRFAEAVVQNGGGTRLPAGIHHLAERYEAHDTHLDTEWTVPPPAVPAPRPIADSIAPPWNVVIFFVDTLRADVAFDPAVMPETGAWMREHLSFSRAYAPGSSTVLTLAPMLSCRYEAGPHSPPGILRAAHDRGMKTALFIPKSASDYHRGAFPAFRFDHEDLINDREKERVATAQRLVERSLDWLGNERPSRFFLWVYHFDVHSWADLAASYVESIAAETGLSQTEGLPRSYRAAARGVDRAFAQLRSGLRDLGLLDRTLIVFLADHGEGLGKEGFWGHSTHLWESLVRVPLALEAPGLLPRQIDTPVSLIDVPTTLSRFIGALPDEERCHGEDLLDDSLERRRLPILLSATVDGELARVGLLDSNRKLEVDLREGNARLLDLPSEEDISARASSDLAHLLNRLVRSPIYPRR